MSHSSWRSWWMVLVLGVAACGDRSQASAPGAFAIRGVIEGFYGQPYDEAARARLIRFMGDRGMNAYVYAPKNDPLHRDRWRDPYPAEQLAEFGELARIGADAGVRFVFAIAPGITFDPDDPAEFARLEDKLRTIHGAGVTGFALLFDDLLDPASTALDPELQAGLTAQVASLVRDFDPESTFWFISHIYAGQAEDLRANRGLFAALSPLPPQVYYDAFAALVPPDLPIMWTGPGVFTSRLSRADTAAFREFAGRPVIVWDNYPANDAVPAELFLGPYTGRDPDLGEAAHGVVLNLMLQPTASLLPVATAADYFRDPEAYQPERAWDDALQAVGGSGASALRLFAEQHRGHPVLAGAMEAVELGRLIDAAFDGGSVEELRTYLERLQSNHDVLSGSLEDRRLFAEIEPWSAKLARLAGAALAGLDALEGRVSPEEYLGQREEALATPQRVAADRSTPGLAALSGGVVNPDVDRFADLFAAIDARL